MLGRRPGGMPVRVIARQPRPVLPRSTDHDSLASAGGNKAGGDAAIHHSVRRSGTRTSLTMKMGCALWHPVGAGSAGSRHAACCGAPNNRHTSPGAPAAVAPVRPAPKRNPHSTSLRESWFCDDTVDLTLVETLFYSQKVEELGNGLNT